jgi:hypothetical protein
MRVHIASIPVGKGLLQKKFVKIRVIRGNSKIILLSLMHFF